MTEHNNIMERIKIKQAEERSRFDAIREHARKQGYVIVQESTRIYLLVKIEEVGGCWSEPQHGVDIMKGVRPRFFTNMGGKIVCRGNFEKVRQHIAANADPIPPELAPQ